MIRYFKETIFKGAFHPTVKTSDKLNQIGSSVNSKFYCSQVTPQIPAAIATIVVGCDEVDHWDHLQRKLSPLLSAESFREVGRVRFSKWRVSDEHFEDLVLCRVNDQVLELHCHGGIAVRKRIIEQLAEAGIPEIGPQQFDLRFTDGQLGGIDVEANAILPNALGERATAIVLDQLNGCLGAEISEIGILLSSDPQMALERIEKLIQLRSITEHLVAPWDVVLAGPPNVGKSSLINALTGQAKAIVHHTAGTTRDWIEATIGYDGWLLRLSDTAGMRDALDTIEVAGVEKTRERLKAADLICIVVDAGIGWTDVHQEVLSDLSDQQAALVVHNKVDLEAKKALPNISVPRVEVTCLQPEQAAASVIAGLIKCLPIRNLPPSTPVPVSVGQIEKLEQVANSIASDAMEQAFAKLREFF